MSDPFPAWFLDKIYLYFGDMKKSGLVVLLAFILSGICILSRCESEGFPQVIEGIYGKWSVVEITGGFSGLGYKPKYDVLEIDNKLQFSLMRNDTLISNGRMEILDKNSEVLRVKMVSENTDMNYLSGLKNVRLNADTLMFYDDCCDLYTYLFVRKKK
jgi:hypothetical protein